MTCATIKKFFFAERQTERQTDGNRTDIEAQIVVYILCFLSNIVIVDASESCNQVNFNIGGDTSISRSWDILVTQFSCGDIDLAGMYIFL